MKTRARKKVANRRWSGEVTRKSNAMDLEPSVFKKSHPRAIAKSLKRSAERSRRRKSPPFQSAMSVLNFYINRGGANIPATQKKILIRAKDELRKLFQANIELGNRSRAGGLQIFAERKERNGKEPEGG
jgi:hypothetical protein